MKARLLASLILMLCLIVSCFTTQMMTSKTVTANQMDTILYIRPITNISTITQVDILEYDARESALATSNINKKLLAFFSPSVHLQQSINDSILQYRIDEKIIKLIDFIEDEQYIKHAVIPRLLDSLMKAQGANYALITYQAGYTRTDDNYSSTKLRYMMSNYNTTGVIDKRTTIKLSTEEFGQSISKLHSTIICFIIDRVNKNIAFYCKNAKDKMVPTDTSTINMQIDQLLNPYFYPERIKKQETGN